MMSKASSTVTVADEESTDGPEWAYRNFQIDGYKPLTGQILEIMEVKSSGNVLSDSRRQLCQRALFLGEMLSIAKDDLYPNVTDIRHVRFVLQSIVLKPSLSEKRSSDVNYEGHTEMHKN